jgi:hypothetical protein
LNCPHCDEEIIYEDATFCPKCGKSLTSEEEVEPQTIETQRRKTDLILGAALLTIISAAVTATIGYTGIYQRQALLDYYGSSIASDILGFLIFGILGIISAGLALIGSMFMLQRKRFKVSMLGAIFPLIAVIGTFIIIQQYEYGFTDTILFAKPLTVILTIIGILLLFKSKTEFK